jgi:signal transduction histidine kinase
MSIGEILSAARREPENGTENAAEVGTRSAFRLGELSAAIAHDFNKLLTIMLGYSELILADLSSGDSARSLVEEINQAVYRGARLTRHLLDFSCPHAPRPEWVDLNAVVQDLDEFLRGLIRGGIDLVRDLTPFAAPVRADRKHLDQVLAILVLAARGSSPLGGCITIETFDVVLPAGSRVGQTEIPTGAYACLAVRTHSTGASLPNRGASVSATGQELPLVQYLIRNNGGHFAVSCTPENATEFRVYLPAAESA